VRGGKPSAYYPSTATLDSKIKCKGSVTIDDVPTEKIEDPRDRRGRRRGLIHFPTDTTDSKTRHQSPTPLPLPKDPLCAGIEGGA